MNCFQFQIHISLPVKSKICSPPTSVDQFMCDQDTFARQILLLVIFYLFIFFNPLLLKLKKNSQVQEPS